MEISPETRGPLISLLTQWYTGADVPTSGDDVTVPDTTAALSDLFLMFMMYVRESQEEFAGAELGAIISMARMFVEYAKETEKSRDTDFRDFLRDQALDAYDDDPGEE